MSDYTIRFPMDVVNHGCYREVTLTDPPARLVPADPADPMACKLGPGSLWTVYAVEGGAGLMLDRGSSVTVSDGTVYRFPDFPLLARRLADEAAERALVALE